MNAEVDALVALQRIKERARAGWRRVPKADAELACCDIFDIASEALAARPAAPPVGATWQADVDPALSPLAQAAEALRQKGEQEKREQAARAAFKAGQASVRVGEAERLHDLRVAVMVAVSNPDLTWPEARKALTEALNAALASPAPQPAESDGSVMVRIDRVYVDAMRGDGLTGPFACVRLVEHEGEPRLELSTAPVPTPDTAEWWREVAQGLGVEIAKLKALASPAPQPAERCTVCADTALPCLTTHAGRRVEPAGFRPCADCQTAWFCRSWNGGVGRCAVPVAATPAPQPAAPAAVFGEAARCSECGQPSHSPGDCYYIPAATPPTREAEPFPLANMDVLCACGHTADLHDCNGVGGCRKCRCELFDLVTPERLAFRAGFMAVWHRDDSWTFNGPSAADKEPAAWAAWEAQNRPEASVDADVAALAPRAPEAAAPARPTEGK